MSILPAALETVTAKYILQICEDQVPEGVEFELKSDLPGKDGRLDAWHSGGSVGEYARNEIAAEIVAFANTLGGTVCVGINETADHPKRASTPHPIPRVHELARRLRQAVYSIIDPPLPVLEAVGVVLDDDSGVVLLRVPASRRRPHRHSVSKEVFVRRNDETVRVSMREIQELTMQAVSEATRIETTISNRRKGFRSKAESRFNLHNGVGVGLHVLCVPTTPVDLVRVVGQPRLITFSPAVVAKFRGGQDIPCVLPFRPLDWRPALRSIIGTGQHSEGAKSSYILQTDGTCELEIIFKITEQRPGVFIGWLMAAMAFILAWTERVKSEAGVPVEFACATQLPIIGRPVALLRYGAQSFEEHDGVNFPQGAHEFPLISVGSAEEFPAILRRFDEDLWNLAGHDIQRIAPTFLVQLNP